MFEAFRDDQGHEFKYLHVYTRIEKCPKWAWTLEQITKGKVYQPDMSDAPAPMERPEVGNKKTKNAKAMGASAERLQSSIETCIADAKTHAVQREEKSAERWKEHFKKEDVMIELLKSTAAVVSSTAAKKRNTDLAFLLGANTATMDSAVLAWYLPSATAS